MGFAARRTNVRGGTHDLGQDPTCEVLLTTGASVPNDVRDHGGFCKK
jgi:hypothetical protein